MRDFIFSSDNRVSAQILYNEISTTVTWSIRTIMLFLYEQWRLTIENNEFQECYGFEAVLETCLVLKIKLPDRVFLRNDFLSTIVPHIFPFLSLQQCTGLRSLSLNLNYQPMLETKKFKKEIQARAVKITEVYQENNKVNGSTN